MLHHYVRPEGIQPPDPGISGVGAGLLKQCPYCKEAREALASINKVLAKVALRATRHEDEDIDTLQPPRITVLGPFKVECGSCKGRGLVLTGYGRRLLAVVKLYLPDVGEDDLVADDGADEIPF